jgi:methylglutaconyl-CoA hydratase
VQGRVLAGGCGLATACDIVIAADSAEFGYPEVRVGFVPAMVMTMLRRCVGEKRAYDLVATGRRIGATEAERIGLVTRVVAAETLEASATELVTSLAALPPSAQQMTKRLFYELDTLDFRTGIAAGVRTNVRSRMTEDFRAGVQAFTRRATS